MLTGAYGEATLDRSNVYRWYKMFSEGREDVNDEERAGRPSTSTTDEKINEVEKMILANRRITVREVAEDLNISIGPCHSIFINDLGMRRVAAKFVPKLLNCDQKQHRMNIANEMLDSVRDDPNLLQRVITGDQAWVYGYDVETKAQSSQWKLPHEPRPKKARQVRSNVKVLLTVFFDCRGVVHHEFLPQSRTVNKEYYLQVMRNLREAIRQKRPDLWKNKNWLLHHDNAPAHTSLLVRDFLTKNNTNDAAATVFPRSGPLIPPRAKSKTTLQDDDVPIDDTTTKPLFTPQEKGRKGLKMEYPGGKNHHFRHLLFFAFHQGQKAAEAARDICNVYGKGVIGEQAAQKWFAKFKNGDLDLEGMPRSGQPSEFDEEHLKVLLKNDGYQTTSKNKARSSPTKVYDLRFLGLRSVLYWEMLERNATVNKNLYIAQLHPMNEAIQQKRPDRQGQIILLHDNARPHVAQVVKATLQELECEVLQHPPYSPDLVPTNYHLFRFMSNHMRGTTFDDEEDLKTWLNNFFDTRLGNFWRKGINKIVERWEEVVNNNEEYIIDQLIVIINVFLSK
ncbi:hypothetical protein LAZ67_16002110 [Cordylochernes scorpioides]|uniref:Transposase n=1 Tax=Cordylochernes scorpioides TaxID=51811 RepID=A0ABY6LGI2_9ARAC|nr:hypothetical protein LAZ67_16002110 [Cordylochernes scorpioides]